MLNNIRADRVKAVRSLAKRSVRERTGRFVVEGPQGVREAIRHTPDRIADVYATRTSIDRYGSDFIEPARTAGLYVHECSDDVLAAMADSETPQGVIAVVRTEPDDLSAVLAGRPNLLIFLAQVRDPGNLGTVIRAADAMGADAVLVSEASVDVLSPKVVRSTAGSLFHLPIVTNLAIEDTLATLGEHGIATLAADGRGERLLPDVDLDRPHAWVMGNEAWGLPAEIRDRCADVVRVPIHERVESLNLAMAATICLYASSRHR